jgi:hypothetical protein
VPITFPSSGGLGPSDATYILQTPWIPSGELPNQQALSPLATGFMSSVTSTGVVSTRTLQGTANQINVTNGTGTGNPVFSLSSSLQLPGTMTFGGNVDANGYNISNIGQANIGNVQISGNTIESTNTNGDLILTPDGTGDLVLDGLNWPQADGTNGQAVTTNGAGQLGWTSFGAPYTPSALTKVDDTNVTLTLGGTPATSLLQAVSLTLGWSGQLGVTRGGTGASSVGANGTLAQSNGSIYTFTTATYPSTTTANQLLYSSATNTVGGLATTNSATLVTNASGVPSWTSSMTNGQVLIGSTGATPVPATITGTLGITVTNAAGSITISGGGGGYTWTEVTGTSQAMAANSGYITNNPALCTLTLPTVAAQGTTISIAGKGAGGWKIAQNAGQEIFFGSSATTIGVTGYLQSTQQYDSIELLCISANTQWTVLTGPQGNITVA